MSISQEAKDIIKEAVDSSRDILILSGSMNFRTATENIVRGLVGSYIRTYGAVISYNKHYEDQVDGKILEDALIKLTEDKITALVKVSNQEIGSMKLYKKITPLRGEIYDNIILTAVKFGSDDNWLFDMRNKIINEFINLYDPLIITMDREIGVKIYLKIYKGNELIHRETINKLLLADSYPRREYDG